MIDTVAPVTDPERLAALRQLILLDTPAEGSFDRLATLATRMLRVPVALVTLVDGDRQFFKSCVGLPEPWATARQTPLSHSFCQHVVAARAPLVVEDARVHPLLRDNLAVPDLGVVAYLGIPLVTADGHVLGSFCAIDDRPRCWTDEDIAILTELTASVMTEIELRAANAQLAELDRLREEFVASISHELRTPLTAASAALQLVRISAADRLRDDERALLDNGQRSAERLGRLIDDLLTLNQLTAGMLHLTREPLDLRDVVHGAVAMVEPLLREKDQMLVTTLPEPLPAMGDDRRLEQIVVNLLANAHRHTPPRTSIVVAGALAGDKLRLVVRDNGPGIPAGECEAIFR
ncbi:MAG: hypothetical protein AVDCRST_MAG88-23, partial [uncultured Thermomicrobiales bacterium]